MNVKSPNFVGDNGRVYLVRCYVCDSENYAMAVATGCCAWCGYNANSDDDKECK